MENRRETSQVMFTFILLLILWLSPPARLEYVGLGRIDNIESMLITQSKSIKSKWLFMRLKNYRVQIVAYIRCNTYFTVLPKMKKAKAAYRPRINPNPS